VREEIKKHYDIFSSDYDRDRTRRYFNFVNDMETGILFDYCKNKDVLEIGCGTGIILRKIQKVVRFGIGVDLSGEMLKIAYSKDLEVVQGDVVNLPFEDETFDVTFSFKVLSHVPEIEKAISEISRVTKKHGVMILEFYNPLSFKFLVNRFFYHHAYQRFYSYWAVKELLPRNVKLEAFKGIRIFLLVGFLLRVPFLSKILIFLEKKFSESKLGLFGGYFNVILRRL
jgi:ubiquinone/menaquinone biosynthesis C-methylase UbiE